MKKTASFLLIFLTYLRQTSSPSCPAPLELPGQMVSWREKTVSSEGLTAPTSHPVSPGSQEALTIPAPFWAQIGSRGWVLANEMWRNRNHFRLPVSSPSPACLCAVRVYFVSKLGNMFYLFPCVAVLKENDLVLRKYQVIFDIVSSLICNAFTKNPDSEAQGAGRAMWWKRRVWLTALNCEMCNQSIIIC